MPCGCSSALYPHTRTHPTPPPQPPPVAGIGHLFSIHFFIVSFVDICWADDKPGTHTNATDTHISPQSSVIQIDDAVMTVMLVYFIKNDYCGVDGQEWA
jgi:hypothetical protein